MSWRFRKSFTVVPGLKLNLSSRGLSASIGASPFTLNVSSRGSTATASFPGTGVSYRQTIGERYAQVQESEQNRIGSEPVALPPVSPLEIGGPIQRIRSASTETMTSEQLSDVKALIQMSYQQHTEMAERLRNSLNARAEAQSRFESWQHGFLLKRIFPARFVIRREAYEIEVARVEELEEQVHLSRISAEIELDPLQAELFFRMCDAFAGLSECSAIWDVQSRQLIDRVRERSYAGTAVSREPVRFELAECDLIAWEKKVPHIANAKGSDIYLYPGFILYRAARQAFSLIAYHELALKVDSLRFEEQGRVPSDATVVGQTWLHVNKDGSRDRRFRANQQLPIALYGALSFKTAHGLWEEFQVSDPGRLTPFIEAIQAFSNSFEAIPTGASHGVPPT